MNFDFVKNKAVILPLENSEAHGFATYRICANTHGPQLAEEIAIGQSLGAWDEQHASAHSLVKRVAKIVNFSTKNNFHVVTIAFPWSDWHGDLSAFLTLAFGKMSFYPNVQLSDVSFSAKCFESSFLKGPQHATSSLRRLSGAAPDKPLLMGILKPNVAMSDETIVTLFCEAAQAGVHLLKDDEIRFDAQLTDALTRIEAVANAKERKGLKTLYAVHLQTSFKGVDAQLVKQFENAGASALLFNPWIGGLGSLQHLRTLTTLPLLAHPALAGAFGTGSMANIHPRVALGSLVRAAGADLTLFPSPYGKIGLSLDDSHSIAAASLTAAEGWKGVCSTTPVPSAGIKPEHAPKAIQDFGNDFVLNAGTAIFANGQTVAENVTAFRKGLGL